MANVTNLSSGSSGEEVRRLQQALIDAGYDVGESGADGIFGNNTLAAVRQYQSNNGLTVDGIAGANTQDHLYRNAATGTPVAGNNNPNGTGSSGSGSENAAAPATPTTPTAPTPPSGGGETTAPTTGTSEAPPFTYEDFTYDAFDPVNDPVIQAAHTLLQDHMQNKPGEYTPEWENEADAYRSQYENRDPFSYNFNSDALYQQYKDQYIQQGQFAMMDAMGQAAAMTGGYGNSYAQTVGQQAYNQQLGQLNNVIPELYQMAYDRYDQQGQDLLAMYDLYMDREDQNYRMYQDNMDQWYKTLDYLTGNYDTVYDRAWNEYREDVEDDQWQQTHDATERERERSHLIDLLTNTGYEPSDSELEAAGISKSQAQAYKQAYENSLRSTGDTGDEEKPNYAEFNYEEQAKWMKEFDRATKLSDVERIGDRMEHAGIDPKIIASWVDHYSAKFAPAPPPNPGGTTTTPPPSGRNLSGDRFGVKFEIR